MASPAITLADDLCEPPRGRQASSVAGQEASPKPPPKESRKHWVKTSEKLAARVDKELGNYIQDDATGVLLDGNHKYAAKELVKQDYRQAYNENPAFDNTLSVLYTGLNEATAR